MSQLPPQMPPTMYPPQQGYAPYPQPVGQRANGPAIASLVCGILGCIPLITSFLAIIFGVVGLNKTKDPQVGGKVLAIVGLILGLLGLAGWGLAGGGMYFAYAKSQPARAVAKQFAVDISTGNLAGAAKASTMTPDELDAAAQNIKSLGAIKDTTIFGFNFSTTPAGTTCEITGLAVFTNGMTKAYTATLVKVGDEYKVQTFHFQ